MHRNSFVHVMYYSLLEDYQESLEQSYTYKNEGGATKLIKQWFASRKETVMFE